MLDIDGTVVPYDYNALPSERIINAIQKARELVSVSLVTGRSYGFTKPVLEALNLHKGYIVLNNGAQVLDLATLKLLYDQPINMDDAEEIVEELFKEKLEFFIKQEVFGLSYQHHPFRKSDILTKPYYFFTNEKYPEDVIDRIMKKLSILTNVTMYKSSHSDPARFAFTASHAKATKLHGIICIMEKLNISKDEVIGVGDSYNDFPLLMASGLKIAMGNAIDELKAIADFVTPSVHDDGVATVIEKFILNASSSTDKS